MKGVESLFHKTEALQRRLGSEKDSSYAAKGLHFVDAVGLALRTYLSSLSRPRDRSLRKENQAQCSPRGGLLEDDLSASTSCSLKAVEFSTIRQSFLSAGAVRCAGGVFER